MDLEELRELHRQLGETIAILERMEPMLRAWRASASESALEASPARDAAAAADPPPPAVLAQPVPAAADAGAISSPSPTERVCEGCGSLFAANPRAPKKRFCSSVCYESARHLRRRKAQAAGAAPSLCARCGEPLPADARAGGRPRRYCSPSCRARYLAAERRRRQKAAPAAEAAAPPASASPASEHPVAETASTSAKAAPLPPRRGSPFNPPLAPQRVEPDPRLDTMLRDLGKLPPATGIFPPKSREDPPRVPYAPENRRGERGAREGASIAI